MYFAIAERAVILPQKKPKVQGVKNVYDPGKVELARSNATA